MAHSRAFKVSFSLVASLGLLVLTLSYLDWRQLDRALRHLSWAWAAGMVAALLAFQAFRTLRTALLIGGGRRWPLFNTLCLQSSLNLLLPYGLGDLALIYLIKKRHQVTGHHSTTIVVFGRYLDVVLLCLCYLMALAFEWRHWPWEVVAVIGVLGGGLVAVSLTSLVLLRWSAQGRFSRSRLGALVLRHWGLFRDALRIMLARRTLVPAVLWSAAMWACMYIFFFASVRAMGTALAPASVLLLFVLLDLMYFLPVRGVANLGSHEAGWFFALRILQVDATSAAVLSFGTHILFTGAYLAMAIVPGMDAAWRWLWRDRARMEATLRS